MPQRTSGNSVLDTMKKFDMFGAPVPTFNMNGDERVSSHAGGCVSLLIFAVTTSFAIMKLADMLQRQNPAVTQFVQQDAFSADEVYDLRENNFRMAFGIEHIFTGNSLDDQRYVRWVAHYH